MKKIQVTYPMSDAYFYNKGEEYLVVAGTAVSWEVATGLHKGKFVFHGHSKVIGEVTDRTVTPLKTIKEENPLEDILL